MVVNGGDLRRLTGGGVVVDGGAGSNFSSAATTDSLVFSVVPASGTNFVMLGSVVLAENSDKN